MKTKTTPKTKTTTDWNALNQRLAAFAAKIRSTK
jgi:hypothetical protein